jgi:DNA-binding CsgD family transcriptional regulator
MTMQGGRPALPWQRPELISDVSVHGRELMALTRIGRLAATSGPIAERAALAVETIAEVMPFDAVALSAWDPLAGRHRNVAMLGLPEQVRVGAGEDPFLDDPGYRYVRSRRAPHRRCDVPGAGESKLIAERLEPAGFAEGVTGCLFTRDGWYTGVLNLASRSDEPANTEAMLLVTVIADALAELVDVTRDVHAAADALDPEMAAAIVHVDGRSRPLPDRPVCAPLRKGGALLSEARRRRPHDVGAQAFLWHEEGVLWRVVVIRLGGPGEERGSLLVAAVPTELPLSLRELEVLTALAAGWSNPLIAERLSISRHTVATHVEHILHKLGVGGRVEAAARAMRDGLLLGGRA